MTYPIRALSRAALLGCAAALAWSADATAQPPEPAPRARAEVLPAGVVLTPSSSIPGATGTFHTRDRIFIPKIHPADSFPSGFSETPASLACIYGLAPKVKGCNPGTVRTLATGGSRVIADVVAYHYPTAAQDLNIYSRYFGLPGVTKNNFRVVYASGMQPQQDPTGSWESEAALDLDMMRALAPNAKLILVEADSNSQSDLYTAVQVAAKLVAAGGGGEVTTSWGGEEFPGEEQAEQYFIEPGVVFFNASGDTPGDEIPAAFSNVVGVGGTSIDRNAKGNFQAQGSYGKTAGGLSSQVPLPPYQSALANILGGARGTPDVAMVADYYPPAYGVWVYDTTPILDADGNPYFIQWGEFGGTSVAAPLMASLVNNAGAFNTSSVAELTQIYANYGNKKAFQDIKLGTCVSEFPINGTYYPAKGWDACTGVGAPIGLIGK